MAWASLGFSSVATKLHLSLTILTSWLQVCSLWGSTLHSSHRIPCGNRIPLRFAFQRSESYFTGCYAASGLELFEVRYCLRSLINEELRHASLPNKVLWHSSENFGSVISLGLAPKSVAKRLFPRSIWSSARFFFNDWNLWWPRLVLKRPCLL